MECGIHLILYDLFNTKGRLSAAASIGMIMLWDVETALNVISDYQTSEDYHVKVAIICSPW